MNHIKLDKKIIEDELCLLDRLKSLEVLSKFDSVIDNLEFKCKKVLSKEVIKFNVKSVENLSLSSEISIPLKISGKFLGEGRHKNKFYTKEELKKSAERYGNVSIPLKVDHRHTEAGATVGAITKIFWDDNEEVLRYEGHINDLTQAMNVIDGVVKEVSASILSYIVNHPLYGITGIDLEYPEISLVEKGSYLSNSIEAVV